MGSKLDSEMVGRHSNVSLALINKVQYLGNNKSLKDIDFTFAFPAFLLPFPVYFAIFSYPQHRQLMIVSCASCSETFLD